ncbi:MAG: hypothetical protein WBC05_17995, partial [Sedimentisphaerales bacterium]
ALWTPKIRFQPKKRDSASFYGLEEFGQTRILLLFMDLRNSGYIAQTTKNLDPCPFLWTGEIREMPFFWVGKTQ